MRIALVVHGFPPLERTGVENYTAGMAAALARLGHRVEVFTRRSDPTRADWSLRREERDGYAVNWLIDNQLPGGPRDTLDRPAAARAFGIFLESERPELVHFQHVIKLGVSLFEEVHARGIPMAYTAHDYFAVCHRYTLLRPDLQHCEIRGDSMLCGLCDVALGHLNRIESLGDYQMGALPGQLGLQERAQLEAILLDDPAAAGRSPEEFDDATDLRRELDSLRNNAFQRVDRFFAPTEFLKGELIRGGIERERIEVLPYGIEVDDLRSVPRVGAGSGSTGSTTSTGPLRFAFFGGISKHKGIHVLLDAFEQVTDGAELAVWGYSTDTPYLESMRSRAAEVGAKWEGAYERARLPELLAAVDVVVVPSIWVENQPLVIREAFAAGRPVITNRLGAMPESVAHEESGLLVDPNDPADLAAAMRRFVSEEGLLARLAAGIPEVKGVAEQADELVERYAELLGQANADEEEEPDPLPASLEAFSKRLSNLRQAPTRDLFERALSGIEKLRAGLGAPSVGVAQLLADAVGQGSRSQRLLRDVRSENEWMKATVEAERMSEKSLREELTWREDELRARDETLQASEKEREWLRGVVQAKEEAVEAREREVASLGRDLVHSEKALEDARRDLQAKDETLAGVQEQLDWLQGQLDELERARLELAGLVRELERGAFHEEGTEADDGRPLYELALAGLRAQVARSEAEAAPLLDAMQWTAREVGQPVLSADKLPDPYARGEELARALVSGREWFGEVSAELAWRRAEMNAAVGRARKLLTKVVTAGLGLGKQVRGWEAGPPDSPNSSGGPERPDAGGEAR